MGTFTTLAVCFILATLCWTIYLLQEVREGRARYLMIMVGLVALFHGLRLLTASGVEELQVVAAYSGAVDLMVATLTFAALVVLRAETTRHLATRLQLRLSQAMEPPAPEPGEKAIAEVVSPKRVSPEEKKARSEVALDQLIQSSSIAIVALDKRGEVCSCNSAAEELYGAGKNGLLGKPLPQLKAPLDSAERGSRDLRAAEAHS